MSPGVTFERVYHELKRQLREGLLRPAMPVEPAVVSSELGASITPIRDALHRLVGEGLVDAPAHDGFRVPRPTEAALRDLYGWSAGVLGLAVRRIPFESPDDGSALPPAMGEVASATAALFLAIARSTGSGEHARAVALLNDRLAPYRRLEARVLDGVTGEYATLVKLHAAGDRAGLNRALGRYHRRRAPAVPYILELACAVE